MSTPKFYTICLQPGESQTITPPSGTHIISLRIDNPHRSTFWFSLDQPGSEMLPELSPLTQKVNQWQKLVLLPTCPARLFSVLADRDLVCFDVLLGLAAIEVAKQ